MKTTNKLKLLFCFFVGAYFFAGLISCKKNSTTTPKKASTPFATINGSTEGSWTIICDTVAGSGTIFIDGSCNGYVVSLSLVDVADTGVYPLGVLENCQANVEYQNQSYQAGINNNGTLHVTSKNTAKKTISGTFSFQATGQTSNINVTNGVFTNLTY